MGPRTGSLVATTAALLLTGCTYVVKPRTEVYYDEPCDIEFEQAMLTIEQPEVWFPRRPPPHDPGFGGR